MALAAQIYLMKNPGERRAAPRRLIAHDTTVRVSGLPVDVLLHDLSETGASIETAVPMAEGATVTIGLAGVGQFEAQLISATGPRYGCRFTRPLSAAQAASAFQIDPIVTAPFAITARRSSDMVERKGPKWPGLVRVALPTGIALGGWAVLIELARRSAGW